MLTLTLDLCVLAKGDSWMDSDEILVSGTSFRHFRRTSKERQKDCDQSKKEADESEKLTFR